MPAYITQYAPSDSYRIYPGRPRLGIYLHHTAVSIYSALPKPKLGSSWHLLFAPSGDIYKAVPETAAPHCVLKTDRMTPLWQVRCPDGRVSNANYCADHWEIQYAPQLGERPTPEQHASVHWALRSHETMFGPTPVLGHGQVQSDKWVTEPHDFDWYLAGMGEYTPYVGRFLLPELPVPPPPEDDEIKKYFELYGQPINPDTAIMQRAYAAYRKGEDRGPAISGEYAHVYPDGRQVIRQKFTAGIIEYDLSSGGLAWVEVCLHPDQIHA